MSIKFEAVLEPRTKDGGFGPSECSKCGAKTTCYLMIRVLGINSFLLCLGCLDEGKETINDAMIESYKNATSGGNR
jgi:hypothetical protein